MKKLLFVLVSSVVYVNVMYADAPAQSEPIKQSWSTTRLSQDRKVSVQNYSNGYVQFWFWGYDAGDKSLLISTPVLGKKERYSNIKSGDLLIPKGFRLVNVGARYYSDAQGKFPVDFDPSIGFQMDFQVESLYAGDYIPDLVQIYGNINQAYNAPYARFMSLRMGEGPFKKLRPDYLKISSTNQGDLNNKLFVVECF
jgi:hypothetical protein